MFESTYTDELPWYRGNLHTHTTESDGRRAPQVVVDDYASRGYDFLAISDHDGRTDVEALSDQGMVLIGANEITANGPHILHIHTRRAVEPDADRQVAIDTAAEEPDSFTVLAHPNWHSNYNHFPQERMEALTGYVGVELYNGVIERLPGDAIASDRWDMLLSKGRRVWGFANDDSHMDGDVELGWNVVQAAERSADALVDAMKRGAFYGSTGVELERIGASGATLRAAATEEVRWEVRQHGSRRIWSGVGRSMEWTAPENFSAPFVRIEAHGALGASAWTQPFFRR